MPNDVGEYPLVSLSTMLREDVSRRGREHFVFRPSGYVVGKCNCFHCEQRVNDVHQPMCLDCEVCLRYTVLMECKYTGSVVCIVRSVSCVGGSFRLQICNRTETNPNWKTPLRRLAPPGTSVVEKIFHKSFHEKIAHLHLLLTRKPHTQIMRQAAHRLEDRASKPVSPNKKCRWTRQRKMVRTTIDTKLIKMPKTRR